MSKQVINHGTVAGDGTGESIFSAFDKCNDNFDELYLADTTLAGVDSVLASAIDALEVVTENAQIVSYVLVLADNLKLVTVANANACTLTVPPNSSVAFPVGATIAICQGGAGQVTVTEGAGVTINSADSAKKLTGQWATASLIKTATDTWLLTGSIEA